MSVKERLLDNAQRFLAKGQLAKAIGEYQKLVATFPRDYRNLQKLAELLCREQRQAEALPHFEAVAANFAATGFYLKAIAIYKQIQKIDPASTATALRIAELYEKQGLIGSALSEYRQLFLDHDKHGRVSEALTLLPKMISLDPGNTALRCRLIETLLAAGDEGQAVEAFRALVRLLEEKGEHAGIARLHEQFPGLSPIAGDVPESLAPPLGGTVAPSSEPAAPGAAPVSRPAPGTPPEPAPVTSAGPVFELELEFDLDGIEELAGTPSSAEPDAAAVLSAAPDELLAENDGAELEILTELDEVVDVPASGDEEAQSHFDLGIAYKEMGRYQAAIEEFGLAAANPSRLPDCLVLIGQCLADQGDTAAAEEAFREALGLPALSDDLCMALRYELGLLYEASARPLEALESFQFVADHDQFFRDVAAKLQALRRQLGLDEPDLPAGGSDRISYL